MFVLARCSLRPTSGLQSPLHDQPAQNPPIYDQPVQKTSHHHPARSDMKNLIQEACQGPLRDACKAHGADVSGLTADALRPVVLRDFQVQPTAGAPAEMRLACVHACCYLHDCCNGRESNCACAISLIPTRVTTYRRRCVLRRLPWSRLRSSGECASSHSVLHVGWFAAVPAEQAFQQSDDLPSRLPLAVHSCRYEKYNEKHGAKLSSSMEEEEEEEDW